MAEVTYLEAIRQGLFEEMERDPEVICLGEDIGAYGGAFKVTEGLQARFGEQRVIDTPLSEAAIVGAAAGAASLGGECARAVADDSSANALAKPAMNRNMFDPPDENYSGGPAAKSATRRPRLDHR